MDIRIETIEPIRVVYFRATGPYEQTLPPTWAKMSAYAKRRHLYQANTLHLTISHNPRAALPEELVADACMSVSEDFVPDEDAQVQTIPAGSYAIARYIGPYEGLSKAWGEFCDKAIPQSGYRYRASPCFEIYRNNPASAPPASLITDLYFPVHPK